MGQLIELVFEAMPSSTAEAMLTEVLKLATRLDSARIDDSEVTDCSARDVIGTVSFSATLRLNGLHLGKMGIIPNVNVRILRLPAGIDLELNLDLDDVADLDLLANELHWLARELAGQPSTIHYFAGLEPAADEDTRIFTDEMVGPLRFPASSGA